MNIKPLLQHEVPDKDNILYLDKQKLLPQVRGTVIQNMLRILGECPDCHKQRWIRVNSIRSRKIKTTLCSLCSRRRTGGPIIKKGYSINNGYRAIHIKTLSASDQKLAKQYLSTHRNYVSEHRLVALKKYGPELFMTGSIVVRHLDGDRLNNEPENIAIGTQKDNIRDHMTANNEAKQWRAIAMNLIRYIQDNDL